MDDKVLIETYEVFNTPVDQFIGNQGLAEAFVAAVQDRLGSEDADPQEILRRLVYLRKRGRLPRLRRNYYGRNPSNN